MLILHNLLYLPAGSYLPNFFFMAMTLESRHKGSNALSLRNLVVDQERMISPGSGWGLSTVSSLQCFDTAG